MSTRTLYLIIWPAPKNQRAHFGIWAPDEEDGLVGTAIHVVGTPMSGFKLEFKRKYDHTKTARAPQLVPLGEVQEDLIHKWDGERMDHYTAMGTLEKIAEQVPPPRKSENFLAPVNDEWTMDYVRRLVQKGYLQESAIETVQARRDPPNVGIGLRPAAERQQQAAEQAGPQNE
ncbi:hypothetical protein J4E86_010965 [Alternaria arbusti]|uniref:uncharacterized protein n=1 Tax=Alternaria arbusti TaxID=232088 RepID=UPI0022205DB4|nr:uncharacterized protein J4E86_010965 [Alternaria arbusti]KAI4940331.1 hypothetical protein J4E86_010965 [Alternaria arbusti]